VSSIRPGGQLIVEIPDRALAIRAKVQLRFQIYRTARMLGMPIAALNRAGLSGASMLTVPEPEVRACLQRLGVDIVRTVTDAVGAYRQIVYVGAVGHAAGTM
jgi:N6-adenosine-specific RNA methylase IME4